ncbi:uncharacterized protein METZ01_LOCUS252992 [marine metagenome]|uniref:Uncharacterized protein n=1 Tax=marine metagenome TaxID=408172 RepID=A0A382IKP2_9ZZZZ
MMERSTVRSTSYTKERINWNSPGYGKNSFPITPTTSD